MDGTWISKSPLFPDTSPIYPKHSGQSMITSTPKKVRLNNIVFVNIYLCKLDMGFLSFFFVLLYNSAIQVNMKHRVTARNTRAMSNVRWGCKCEYSESPLPVGKYHYYRCL